MINDRTAIGDRSRILKRNVGRATSRRPRVVLSQMFLLCKPVDHSALMVLTQPQGNPFRLRTRSSRNEGKWE